MRRDFVDPAFRAEGLKGSLVTLKCSAPPGMLPFGVAPQDEREILEEMRKAVLARQGGVQPVSETDGRAGDLQPAYSLEVYLNHDRTERKVKKFRGFHRVESTRFILTPQARTRVRRTVSATYTVVHLPSQRVVWRARGNGSFSDWYRINLDTDLLPPDRRPNVGPLLLEVLRPVTRKACARLP